MGPIELGKALGRLEEGVDALRREMAVHTKQDEENFKSLALKIDHLDVRPQVRRMAVKWAAAVGAVIAFAAQVAQAVGWLP